MQVGQTMHFKLRPIRPVMRNVGQYEDTTGTKHAKHLVQGARPIRCNRQVVNDPMRHHRIEARVREGERPRVAGLDPHALGDALSSGIFESGIWGVVGLIRCPTQVDAHCYATAQAKRRADEHQPSPATDIENRFSPCPRRDHPCKVQ